MLNIILFFVLFCSVLLVLLLISHFTFHLIVLNTYSCFYICATRFKRLSPKKTHAGER